jgi:two-component system, OmpR family, response regulator
MLDAHDVFPEPQVLRCGDLVLDESRWTVHRAGVLVDLSPTEFRLLACLLRHQGSVLSRAELLEHVWGHGYTGQSQVVETYVSYLRRKLHRLGPSLIHTRRGAGYLLCASQGGAHEGGAPEAAALDLGTPDLGTPDLGAPWGPAAGGPDLADG